MPTPSLERTLKSVQSLVDQEEWYAAHQKYRTSAARLLKSTAPNSVSDAISLLFEGSRLLLERKQDGSGTDLALMLIKDVYMGKKVPYKPEERNKLLNLIALAGPLGNWRRSIIDMAIAWSADAGECPTGDPAIHLVVGETFLKENNLQFATVHLLSACNRDAAKVLSNVLWTWSRQESKPENNVGKYAGVGVLGYLELGSILAARTFLEGYLAKVKESYPDMFDSTVPSPTDSGSIQIFRIPSLNFLQLMILTCQVGPGTLPNGSNPPANHTGATIGKAVYQAMIGRYSRMEGWLSNAEMKEVYSTLGEMYFGIRQPRPNANMLSDLMGSLFAGGGPPGMAPQSRNRIEKSGGIGNPAVD